MQGQLELTVLDACRVEDLVHDSRDLLDTRLDDRRQLALFARLRPAGQQAGGADHRVELIPQLVADVIEKLRVDLDRTVSVAIRALLWTFGAHLTELATHQ